MAEYAEMIINGDCDMYTGEYIGEGQGFPRIVQSQYLKRNRFGKIKHENYRKVLFYLSKFKQLKNRQNCIELILEYGEYLKEKNKDIPYLSDIIQHNFSKFGSFCYEKFKNEK